MKNFYNILLCLSLTIITPSFGQVGIGTTTPNPDAQLDITSTDRGLLLPRLALTSTASSAPMTADVAGMIVYNTASAGDVTPGFYYNDGAQWVRLGPAGASNDWTTAGNNGTNAATDFIGTTDNNAVKFRSNNLERFQVLNSGEVSVGAGGTMPFAGDTFTSTGDEYPINAWANGTSPGTLLSSAFYANQVGDGTILFGQHDGDGDGIRLQMQNTASSDAGISIIHDGTGSIITGQTQGTGAIAGILTIADFSYTGTDRDDHIGVSGYSYVSWGGGGGNHRGIGVQGTGGTYGVHGIDNSAGNGGVAVFGTGDTGATGTKSFMIDYPLDPANKILKHFSVESNEVLNIYRGTVVFGADGTAVVSMPEYYSEINRNANYQMTPIGSSMPNLYVKTELKKGSNSFVIAGGVPGKKVSWTVTSERNDPYLQKYAHKRENILDKKHNRGKYLMPELFGESVDKRIGYKELKDMKAAKKTKK